MVNKKRKYKVIINLGTFEMNVSATNERNAKKIALDKLSKKRVESLVNKRYCGNGRYEKDIDTQEENQYWK